MKILKFTLALGAVFSILSADAIDNRYRDLVGKSLFISNSSNLSSGSYEFEKSGGDTPELSSSSFVFPYFFGESGDRWRPFVEGGIGFSNIEQDKLALAGGDGDVEFDSMFYKVGAGLTYNPTCDFRFIVGGSALFMSVDGKYSSTTPLGASATDRKIKRVLDSESDSQIYDGYAGFSYKPMINGHHTELKSRLHYVKMSFDHGIDDVDGVHLDVLAKLHGNEFATILEQPLWMEYYVGGDFVNSELADVVGFNSAVTFGSTLHWRFAPLVPILRDSRFKDLDLAFNAQGTAGNNDFKGWKIGVGLSLVKF